VKFYKQILQISPTIFFIAAALGSILTFCIGRESLKDSEPAAIPSGPDLCSRVRSGGQTLHSLQIRKNQKEFEKAR